MILMLLALWGHSVLADDLNQRNSGWTELPRSGGNITLEPARPKPSPTAAPSPVVDTSQSQNLEGLPPEERELIRAHLERQKAFAGMNAGNPMSESFQISALKERLAQQLGFSPEVVAKASNSKALGKLAAFVTSPETLADWEKVLSTPIRSPWIAVELGWVIFFLVLRGWRLSKAQGFGRRIFEHVWLSFAFSLGIFLLIPWLIYGRPYVRLVVGAASALFS